MDNKSRKAEKPARATRDNKDWLAWCGNPCGLQHVHQKSLWKYARLYLRVLALAAALCSTAAPTALAQGLGEDLMPTHDLYGNSAHVMQRGNRNLAEIEQMGRGNVADISQTGDALSSFVGQYGNLNSATVVQGPDSAPVEIHQAEGRAIHVQGQIYGITIIQP